MGMKRVMSLALSIIMLLVVMVPGVSAEDTVLDLVESLPVEAALALEEEAAEEQVLELMEEEEVVVEDEEIVEAAFEAGYVEYAENTCIYADASISGDPVALEEASVVYVFEKNEDVYGIYYAFNGQLYVGYVNGEGVALTAEEAQAYVANAGEAALAIPGYEGCVLAPAAIVGDVEVMESVEIERSEAETGVVIVTQPADIEAVAGDTVTFTVEATGVKSYQWQCTSTNGATWTTLKWDGATTASMSRALNATTVKYQYRCVLTGNDGSVVYTNVIKIVAPAEKFEIVTQPTDITGGAGSTVTFTVEATGVAGYQWQCSSTNGATWTTLSWAGAQTASMTRTLNTNTAKYLYRCVLTGNDGTTLTTNVIKIVAPAEKFEIVTQPTDITGGAGSTVTFTVEATGVTGYQWQCSSTNGATWTTLSWEGAQTASMTRTLNANTAKYLYRCVLTGNDGTTLTTNVIKIVAPAEKFEIVTQPTDISAAAGTEVTFSVVATGATGYQWQCSSTNGATWTTLKWDGATTATMTRTLNATTVKYLYRCVLTGNDGTTLTTNVIKIVAPADPVEIVTQPADIQAVAGDTVTFAVKANNVATYQWQCTSTNGATWTTLKWEGATTDTMTRALNGTTVKYQYRCVLTGNDGSVVYTNVIKIVAPADPVEIVTQPTDIAAVAGDTVTFAVKANNVATYQWQCSSTNGATWTTLKWEGATTDTMTRALNATTVKYQYRCVLTGNDGSVVYTDVINIVAPADPIEIVTQPTDIEAVAGDTVTFSVVANNVATYQWQCSSTEGVTWTTLKWEGATTDTMTRALNATTVKYLYRCVLTGEDGSVVYTDTIKIVAPSELVSGDFTYAYNADKTGVVIVKYNGTAASVVVPATIDNLPVVEIGASAFEGNTVLTTIDLPDTVEVIGKRAFANCTSLSTMN